MRHLALLSLFLSSCFHKLSFHLEPGRNCVLLRQAYTFGTVHSNSSSESLGEGVCPVNRLGRDAV